MLRNRLAGYELTDTRKKTYKDGCIRVQWDRGGSAQPAFASRRNNKMSPHGRSMERKERWAKSHLSQPHPVRTRWPHATQCSNDAAEYDEDGYIGGARTQNWPDDTFMAPPWRD